MPIRNAAIHFIDKKPDGSPAALHKAQAAMPESEVIDNLLADLNDAYNAKQGKAWGCFNVLGNGIPETRDLPEILAEIGDYVPKEALVRGLRYNFEHQV